MMPKNFKRDFLAFLCPYAYSEGSFDMLAFRGIPAHFGNLPKAEANMSYVDKGVAKLGRFK